MLFNTLDFAVFLPIVFLLYWFLTDRNLRMQNVLLVVASYVFYGWWDWRFLSLILFSTLLDYLIGGQLAKQEAPLKRKLLLWTSIFFNLGLLGFFKYYDFFLDSFVEAFSFFGYPISPNRLNIVLPVGISFYTFQTLSYTIDVYRRRLPAAKDFISFSAFVSFFPQLVAGPIERATNLLPQFYRKRTFDFATAADGLRQILWGLFKKVLIADSCAVSVDLIFDNATTYSGSTLLLGAILFAFQIYGDFSGYSDIAIGTAKLFGFRLMRNFAFPYFSRDIAEFWRRWHISLSTWFRDYLYIPLGGSRGSTAMQVRNVFIIFLVSGLWHGANWTFLFWGFLHALFFLPLLLGKKNRRYQDTVAGDKRWPSVREFLEMGMTFLLVTIAWVFFRADSVTDALVYLSRLFTPSILALPEVRPWYVLLAILCMTGIEWVGREGDYGFDKLVSGWHRAPRYALYYVLIFLVFYASGSQQQFIYFQF